MDNLFNEQKQKIRVYIGISSDDDPFEKNKTITMLNPIVVEALVSDLSFTSLQWKIPNINTSKAKELLIKKNKKKLLEMSQKIEIDGTNYEGYKIDGKLSYKEEGNYLRVFVYLKQMS